MRGNNCLLLLVVLIFYAFNVNGARVNVVVPALGNETLDCGSETVNITLTDSYINGLVDHGGSVDRVILVTNKIDPYNTTNDCIASRVAGGYHFLLDARTAQCSLYRRLWINEVEICYELKIIAIIPGGATIVRFIKYKFRLYCKYSRKLYVWIGPFYPLKNKERYYVEDEKSHFDLELHLYNANFTNIIDIGGNFRLTVGDPVYVGVALKPALILQARNCFATPTADINDQRRVYFIKDNCVAQDPLGNGIIELRENFAGPFVKFKFDAYFWIGFPRAETCYIYIHCMVTVCVSKLQNNCTDDGCGSTRRRRSIGETDKEITLTHGPIEVRKPVEEFEVTADDDEQTDTRDTEASHSRLFCNKDVLGCSFDCAVSNMGNVFCLCPPGSGLANDGKTCFNHITVIDKGENSQDEKYAVLSFLIVAVMIGCIALLLKKTSNDE